MSTAAKLVAVAGATGKQGGGVDEDMLLREAGVVGVSKLQIQSYLHGIEVVNLSH